MNKIRFVLATLLTAFLLPIAHGAVELDVSKRYYQVDGAPKFLIGHYDWASITPYSYIDHPSTYRKMIDDAKEHGLNYIRVSLSINRFTASTTPTIYGNKGDTPTPFRYINNKADLDQWNPEFWDGLEQLAIYAEHNDVVLHVSIFDGVPIRSGGQAYRWNNSFWNIDNQVRNFYGDADKNENGSADEKYEFYRSWAFDNSSLNGSEGQKLSYYQKRLIDKALNVLKPHNNVFFEVGNEIFGSDKTWLTKVIAYITSKTNKPVTINQKLIYLPNNADGYADHFGGNNPLQVKNTLSKILGKDMPIWIDPDGPDLMHGNPEGNRKAAWFSLTGGAAAWGGFNTAYWTNNNAGNWLILDYYQNLTKFIDDSGIKFWLMQPNNSVISGASENSALVNPGNEYLVYVYEDSQVTVNLADGNYQYLVYDPVNGTSSPLTTVIGGNWKKFNRPGYISDDWALYIVKTTDLTNDPRECSEPPCDPTGEGDGSNYDNSVECGEPNYDSYTDRGLFLWKDCLDNEWHVRLSGGSQSRVVTAAGTVTSIGGFSNLSKYRYEASDILDNTANMDEIVYKMNVWQKYQDGFDFSPIGANSCFVLNNTIPAYLGQSKQVFNSPLNLDTLASCKIEAEVEAAECGEPSYDTKSEPGLYLWKDCKSNSADAQWHLRVVGNGLVWPPYSGQISSTLPVTVSGFSMEQSDVVDATQGDNGIDYFLYVAKAGVDGLDMIIPAGSQTCFDSLTNPTGSNIYLGKGKAQQSDAFNLEDLGSCQ